MATKETGAAAPPNSPLSRPPQLVWRTGDRETTQRSRSCRAVLGTMAVGPTSARDMRDAVAHADGAFRKAERF